MPTHACTRRGFFAATCCAAVSVTGRTRPISGDDLPPVTDPRATDGDDRHEPDWDEQLTVYVQPGMNRLSSRDLISRDHQAIQGALDYVARWGGGTVQLRPGTYVLRNALVLPSRVRLRGSGPDSIITKIHSETVPLADDSNWFDQEITLRGDHDFRVGDGVLIKTRNPHHGAVDIIKRTLVARTGDRFKLNTGLRSNVWLDGQPTCSSLVPLLTSERASDVIIEDLALDGNGQNNENLNGNYGGCVFLQDCNRFTLRGVEARNYNGDGISFQVCHDVVIERCYCHDNTDLGLHPGSGSQRPLMRDNRLHRNNLGLFWCWGVKYGLAEGNDIDGNRSFGISIGHCDTDNAMRDNRVSNSGQAGSLFRDEPRGADFWPNRNLLEGNTLVDNGGEDGVAIDITGKTRDIQIVRNTLRETRAPARRVGIRIGPAATNIQLQDNSLDGFATPILHLTSDL
jgi:hypothetical protein